MEVPASRWRTPKGYRADSADSPDVGSQPDLGQSTYSRRTSETRSGGFDGYDPEIPPQVRTPSFTKLVDLSPEPLGGHGSDGFLCGPDGDHSPLCVLIVIQHERRKVIHFNITETPTAAWTAQQVINAFPYDTAPKYLLRDRDSIYGLVFVQRVKGMGIKQKLISPRSRWQSPYVERLIGSIRRECLDQVIVFNERQLRRILESYFKYYHEVRPHRSLGHDSPIPRRQQSPERGKVIEMPLVGGLHHQYLRQAAPE